MFVVNTISTWVNMANRADLAKKAATLKPENAHDDSNPKVWFDIKIGNIHAGRITFEVRHISLEMPSVYGHGNR